MMKLHFQVVSLDSKDYILTYKNFGWREMNLMLEYVRGQATRDDCQTLKITRWNEKGEKQ